MEQIYVQKIVCTNGKCVDINNLDCSEKYDDIVDIIDCEELRRMNNNIAAI